jgi:ABC-2 type transport system permease protein
MGRWFANVYHLGLKELVSLASDVILVVFTVFWFSFMVYSEATGVETEVRNTNIAIVDSDKSVLSRRVRDALRPPQFKPAVVIDRAAVDTEMDRGRFTFVLDIPPHFEADILRNRSPRVQLNIDATAVSQAGVGAGYIEEIITREISSYLQTRGVAAAMPVEIVTRAFFNPNLESVWFQSVNALIEKITLISILLVGAAIIREREHGTIEHLLVMPLRASEIAAAKIWANGLAVLAATALSLALVVRLTLQVPIEGSVVLFLIGTAVYLFATTSLGLMLATIANTMPQFGLLVTLVFMTLTLLSGAISPIETMPEVLQAVLHISPTVHYVQFAQGVLYRAANIDIVWPQMLILFCLGGLFTGISLARFRSMLARET